MITLLLILLFVYPWDTNSQQTDAVQFEGMYTITGRAYNELQVYDSPTGCQAMYFKVYKNKMVVTMSVYGTGGYQDVTYTYEKADQSGNRVYRKDKFDAFVVDSQGNLQRIMSTYTYNGNKRIDTYCEVIKGDHSADCLNRQKGALEMERMKTTMDLDGYSW